jgi:hypothetical protein
MIVITNPAINPNLGDLPSKVGGETALQGTLIAFITYGLIIGGLMFVFMFLWGGVEYITAGGDKEGTQKATKRISSALIGITIVFCTFAIISLIEAVFGIDILKFEIPTIG